MYMGPIVDGRVIMKSMTLRERLFLNLLQVRLVQDIPA